MQARLIDQMARIALQHPDWDVSDVYNALMRAIPMSDVEFLSKHYALMLNVARAARAAPPDIQEMILKS